MDLIGSARCSGANEKVPFIHAGRNGHIEKSHHHFIRGLVAPGYQLGGIRIVRIVARVVIPGHRTQLCSSLEYSGFSEAITQLPMKVIVHAQKDLNAAIAELKRFYTGPLIVGADMQCTPVQ